MLNITEPILASQTMSQETFERLTRQLLYDIAVHPNREELVMLATEQILDDL